MAYEFKLPDLGEGLTEGEVARWLVAEGQDVAEDEPLVEIQTDKTTVEIPSPAAGVVSRILVEEGAVVPVGTVLVVIGADGAEPVSETAAATSPGLGHVARRDVSRRRRSSRGSPGSWASTSQRWRAPARAGGSRSRTCALRPGPQSRTRDMARRGAGSRCAGCGGSSQSTWRARTGRCRR